MTPQQWRVVFESKLKGEKPRAQREILETLVGQVQIHTAHDERQRIAQWIQTRLTCSSTHDQRLIKILATDIRSMKDEVPR